MRGVDQGCACLAKILQNCVAHQASERMCAIVFLAFILKLPFQTLLSVVPTQFSVATKISEKRAHPWRCIHLPLCTDLALTCNVYPWSVHYECALPGCARFE